MVSYPNSITGPVTVTGALTASGLVTAQAGESVTGGLTTDTETASGLVTLNGGTKTSGSAPVLAPAFANGTASQLSDLTRDYVVYLQLGTAGTAFSVSIGPTSGVANAVMTSATPLADQLIVIRLPAGWFLKWAGTTTTVANQLAVGC